MRPKGEFIYNRSDERFEDFVAERRHTAANISTIGPLRQKTGPHECTERTVAQIVRHVLEGVVQGLAADLVAASSGTSSGSTAICAMSGAEYDTDADRQP